MDISRCLCTVRHLLSEDEIPVPRGRPLCYGSPEISMYVPPRRAWPHVQKSQMVIEVTACYIQPPNAMILASVEEVTRKVDYSPIFL